MKFNISLKVLPLLACGMLMASCNDFLKQEPLTDITPTDYYKDATQLQAVANAFYQTVLPYHSGAGYGTFAYDNGTDNQTGSDGDSKYKKGSWKTSNDNSSWSWNNIRDINYQLNIAQSNYENGLIAGNENKIRQYIGELHFFRAYAYFSLYKSFGDLPIVTEAMPDNEAILVAANKRSPRNEVARFILADLDSAVTYMEPDGWEATTRISPAVAHLFASRVALFEGSWLTNFAGTPFVPNGEGWPGKAKDYNANYQYPTGSVEAEAKYFFQKAVDEAAIVGDAYVGKLDKNTGIVPQSLSDTNPYFYKFGNTDMSAYPEVLLWKAYNKGKGVTDNIEVAVNRGNTYTGFTRGMIDAFLMEDGKPTYAHHDGYVYEDTTTYAVVRNRDPRLFIFLKRPGQKNVLQGEDNNIAAEQVRPIEPVPQVFTRSFDVTYTTGYAIRKGGTFNQNLAENQAGYTASITFRATEALLNYIEAQYMLDHHLNAKSISYWKAIREAAGFTGEAADPQTTIAATDMAQELKGYTDGSGTQYDWGAFSAGKALTDPTLYSIRRERRTELMAEGLRWMDLIRWRSLDQLMKQPYQLEGFHLWNTPMEKWYTEDQLVDDGSVTATVSSRKLTEYFRPYQIVSTNMLYNGMTWSMAQYLQPMPLRQFMLTAPDHKTYGDSPLYQNPYWPMEPDEAAEQ